MNSRYEIFNCDVYIENGYNKKQRKKHNLKKKNQEKKFLNIMNYNHEYTDKDGNKHGKVSMNNGRKVDMVIHQGKIPLKTEGEKIYSYYNAHHSPEDDVINMSKKHINMKGSEFVGAHEYSHALDSDPNMKNDLKKIKKVKNPIIKEKYENRIYDKTDKKIEQINRKNNFDKKAFAAMRELKETKNTSLTKHNRQLPELRADKFAVQNINPKHGHNMIRKHLNEINRRVLQHESNCQDLSDLGAEYKYSKESIPMLKNYLNFLEEQKKNNNTDRNDSEIEYVRKRISQCNKIISDKNARNVYKNDIKESNKINNKKINKHREIYKIKNQNRMDIGNKLLNK